MPDRLYGHVCTNEHAIAVPWRRCRRCGADGEPAGFSITQEEGLALERYVHGLANHGPHVALGYQLFTPLREQCGRCGGRYVVEIPEPPGWSACPVCEGTGGVWTVSDKAVEMVRQIILQDYPEAALPEPELRPPLPVARRVPADSP